jgi:nickel-dependent lactate racemase
MLQVSTQQGFKEHQTSFFARGEHQTQTHEEYSPRIADVHLF